MHTLTRTLTLVALIATGCIALALTLDLIGA